MVLLYEVCVYCMGVALGALALIAVDRVYSLACNSIHNCVVRCSWLQVITFSHDVKRRYDFMQLVSESLLTTPKLKNFGFHNYILISLQRINEGRRAHNKTAYIYEKQK